MNLHEMLADQIQADRATAAHRVRHDPPRRRPSRVLRHAFLRDRLVVTISYRPTRPAA